jgi:hypothetical protein
MQGAVIIVDQSKSAESQAYVTRFSAAHIEGDKPSLP